MKKRIIACMFLCGMLFTLLAPVHVFADSTTLSYRVSSTTDNINVWSTGPSPNYSMTSVVAVGDDTLNGYTNLSSGFRFNGIMIPVGCTITSAVLSFVADSSSTTTGASTVVSSTMQAQANVLPATFTTYADYGSRSYLPPIVVWSSIGSWSAGVTYQSPDISVLIQSAIGQFGWQPGNSIVLFWNNSGSSVNAMRRAVTYATNPAQAVSLAITYSTNSTVVSTDNTQLVNSINSLQTTVNTLSTSLSAISAQDSAISKVVNTVGSSVQSVQSTVQTMQANAQTQQSSIQAVQTSVQAMQTSIQAMQTTLKSIDTQTSNNATMLSAVSAQQTASKTALDALVKQEASDSAKTQSAVSSLKTWVLLLILLQIVTLVILFSSRQSKKSGSSREL